MNTHADKTQDNKSQSVANAVSQKQSVGESTFQFVENRSEAVDQRELQETVNSSQKVSQLRAFQNMADNSPQAKQTAQLQSVAANHSAQQQNSIQKKENNTGLPDNLKSGIENLSGYSMDDVKVHYNSDKPAQLQAHAYAQGTDIHLASGQEKHLPHEAWHVAQQKQGRVKPTMQMKGMVNINDDAGLEKEADVMGAKALMSRGLQRPALMGDQQGASQRQALQRKPESAKVIWERTHVVTKKNGSLFGGEDFQEGEIGALGELIAGEIIVIDNEKTFRSRRGSHQENVENRGMQHGTDPTIMWFHVLDIKENDVASEKLYVRSETVRVESVVDSERLDTLGPGGRVPEHHELVTFAEKPKIDLYGHSSDPVGYAGKMMGKKGERDDFTRLLKGIKEVILTTGNIDEPELGEGWKQVHIDEAQLGDERRLGLSIINYSQAIYQKGSQLAVCGVRGKILMDQFGLAIREFAHAKTGRSIKISTIFNEGAVQENYSRLLNFFKENKEFRVADTLVFGYASAFEDGLKLIYKVSSHGWVGCLFQREDEGYFAVFDSDLSHSYHGEILAQNVKLLLEDAVGDKVSKVLIGGSAGALVAPHSGVGSGPEESLKHNCIYIPSGILRPDGYFKKNALNSVAMKDTERLSSLPGSMHTSVVSVLAETPSVLDDLFQYGIKTVDMEFAYVALVLGDVQVPMGGKRDLADVALGVACLVTDFPKTGAKNVALSSKDKEAKLLAKKLFVETVLASMH
jgi:hypothetical protein